MMDFDVNEFWRNLNGPARRRARAAGVRAVDHFGLHVLGKAQKITPIEIGTLQNSANDDPAIDTGRTIEKTIGFNTEYAAAVHERLDVHHAQGQAKFLETPMRTEAHKLRPYVAEEMKKAL